MRQMSKVHQPSWSLYYKLTWVDDFENWWGILKLSDLRGEHKSLRWKIGCVHLSYPGYFISIPCLLLRLFHDRERHNLNLVSGLHCRYSYSSVNYFKSIQHWLQYHFFSDASTAVHNFTKLKNYALKQSASICTFICLTHKCSLCIYDQFVEMVLYATIQKEKFVNLQARNFQLTIHG